MSTHSSTTASHDAANDEQELIPLAESTESGQESQQKTPAMAMFRTLTLTALLSGFLVVLVVQWATPYINANQKAATEAAVFRVVEGASVSKSFIINDNGLFPAETTTELSSERGTTIYAGYTADGGLKGVAITGVAPGYAGPVSIMFGYQPELEAITAYQVLTMTETPGLGDKVLTDENFLANFNRLDARLNLDGSALANDIVTVKSGTKINPWEIDAISGASITSEAIGQAIHQSAQQWLPILQSHLDQLKTGGEVKQ